ncbi:MAG: hypothetical protein P4M00_05180 [Azospirillaceae bacterium]|nr:hypothetical protein [Azospirillaceae bacterium]
MPALLSQLAPPGRWPHAPDPIPRGVGAGQESEDRGFPGVAVPGDPSRWQPGLHRDRAFLGPVRPPEQQPVLDGFVAAGGRPDDQRRSDPNRAGRGADTTKQADRGRIPGVAAPSSRAGRPNQAFATPLAPGSGTRDLIGNTAPGAHALDLRSPDLRWNFAQGNVPDLAVPSAITAAPDRRDNTVPASRPFRPGIAPAVPVPGLPRRGSPFPLADRAFVDGFRGPLPVPGISWSLPGAPTPSSDRAMGTPLPRDDPRRQPTAPVEHRIQALRVIHENQAGERLGEETLPVTRVDGARPWGGVP